MENERRLIQALKVGSQSAFNDIYQLYAGQLLSFCISFCKSREESEEIVEDAFISLWKSREDIQQQETLKSYLFVITRRLLIKAYRRRVKSPVFSTYLEIGEDKQVSDDNAVRHMEYDEFVAKLQTAILQLPPTQQHVIRMSKLEGLSNKEIKELLNLSEQTVKNQLSVGLKTLRKKLGIMSFIFFYV